jgi:hypothetical protein
MSFFILQSYYLNRSLIFFENISPYIISRPTLSGIYVPSTLKVCMSCHISAALFYETIKCEDKLHLMQHVKVLPKNVRT